MHTPKWIKFLNLMIPSIGKNYIPGGSVNCYKPFGKLSGNSY